MNPCAEEPLPAGGSCLLGSINLSEFVMDPFTDHAQFDFEGLKHCVQVSVRALNEVLEEGLPLHPLKEQQDSVGQWRQIGLGIMGLADCLIKLGLTYGEEDAVEMCDNIVFAMADSAIAASALLAKEKGPFCGMQYRGNHDHAVFYREHHGKDEGAGAQIRSEKLSAAYDRSHRNAFTMLESPEESSRCMQTIMSARPSLSTGQTSTIKYIQRSWRTI